MRQLIALLVFSQVAFGALSHIADNTCANSTNTTSLALALTTNPTAGSLLLVGVRVGVAGRTVTVTDDKSNTYTSNLTTDATGVGAGEVRVFSAPNVAAGATTVTVAISGAAASVRWCAMEVGGAVTSSSAFDVSVGTSGSSTTPNSGATSTRAQANELILGVQTNDNSATVTLTAGTNFTIGSISGCGSTTQCLGLEWQIVSATGTDACTFTLSVSHPWGAGCATYKEAGGAATTVIKRSNIL